ncbi:extracellular solute-binding protein [Clostridium tarantellae]|uniref:Extracellular solute-binding protein n=1 Tax=Clostridium tarantellae TaxID=39493 RepID=A0A6I1MLB0_9CLOT|nr:extracellular solute-binding protein [Clostridium tarantellae]
MKLKKLLAVAVATIMTTSMLAGCGGSDSGASGSNGDKPVTLTWYTVGEAPKDLAIVQSKLNEYLDEKINVNVDMRFIGYGDYDKKMSVIVNSGEEYDIMFTNAWNYLSNARKGAYVDLSEMLDNQGKGMKETVDPRFWEGVEVDGKIYGIPAQKELGVAPMWAFTKEYVDKYNIPYEDIHNFEDLEPWLKVIKENEPDVVPFYIAGNGFTAQTTFDYVIEPVGISYSDPYNEDGTFKVQNIFETPEMEKTLKTLRKYYEAGYINQDSATTQDNKAVKRFVTKGDGCPGADAIWSKDLKYPVVTSQIMDTYITNTSTTGSVMAVSSTSKNPEKAVEFLNLLNTDSYVRNMVNYGLEGTHYEKIGDNQIKLDETKSKDYSVPYYTLGNMYLLDVLDTEETNKWDTFEEFNAEAKVSPILGFKFNTEPVSTEIAAITNVLDEFRTILYSGSVNVDEYLPKLNAKLKEQGIGKIIEEMQTQIDKWAKENDKLKK